MIGLVATYFIGKDVARKQERKAANVDPKVTGTGIIGFCAVVGSLLTDDAGTGFMYGLAIGATVWLLGGALINESRAQVTAVVTIVGGAWIGWMIGGKDSVIPGALWGLPVFIGWVLSRLVWGAHVEPLDEDEDEDEDAEVEAA